MIIPTGQVDRTLPGAPCSLALAPETPQGTAYTLTAPATVAVADADGESVYSGTAAVATDGHSLTATIPASTFTELDSYAVTWSALSGGVAIQFGSVLETCGGFLFGVGEFRGDSARKEFVELPAARILRARTLAERAFEQRCKVAFVPRGAREDIAGSGREVLVIGRVALRELESLSIDGTEMTDAELAALTTDECGLITRPSGVWPTGSVVSVRYSHGYDRPDDPVSDAVKRLAREYLFPDSKLPPRAVLQATEYGNFRLATPDDENPFGIPDVDAVYREYRRVIPGVG